MVFGVCTFWSCLLNDKKMIKLVYKTQIVLLFIAQKSRSRKLPSFLCASLNGRTPAACVR